MLDIKVIRQDPEAVKAAMRSRNADLDAKIDEILAIDEKRRALGTELDAKKAEQNKKSKEIPAAIKAGGDINAIKAELKVLSDEIKDGDAELSALEEKQRQILLMIPNVPHASVPVGKDDSDNVEIRRNGEPTKFDFEPKPHWEIGAKLGILDPERAAKVTGTRFHFYKDLGAKIGRAHV